MTSGIEWAGLALAIFPVVVEIIDWYSGSVSGRDTKFLAESLKNQELIFRDSIEALLRSVLSATEQRSLLDDLGGQSWKDASISAKVVECLGKEADGLVEIANGIYEDVMKLKEKLPVSQNSY